MALLKWLFHKNIDSEHLKKEIGELAEFFKEYILFFKQKKSEWQLESKGLTLLKPTVTRFITLLKKELEDEENERKIIELISKHDVLTAKEKKEIGLLRNKLSELKQVLEEQRKLIIEDEEYRKKEWSDDLVGYVLELRKRFKAAIWKEQELLFGEERVLNQLVKDIIKGEEFPVVNKVSCPATKTAILSNKYFCLFKSSRIRISFVADMPIKIASKKCHIAFYPGSADDPILLFCFPKAKVYIMQDPFRVEKKLKKWMQILNRTNIIQNLRIGSVGVKNRYDFRFNGENKKLVAYYGKHKGDSTKYVPPEIKTHGVDVVMSKAFTVSDRIKNKVLQNLLPRMNKGCYINDWLKVDGRKNKQNNFEDAWLKKVSDRWWVK